MSEERKKHFDIYKYLCFPWGAFITTGLWYGVIKIIEEFLKNITYEENEGKLVPLPWWVIWALFGIGTVIIFIVSALYSYRLPKGDRQKHNVYVLITPEYSEDDRYIRNDFINNFERHAKGSIENLNLILPSFIKRETFNRRVAHYTHKHKDFWESKCWKKLHKRLKGALYISGSLKRRNSQGKEKFVFLLSATIGYNDFNQNITPLLIDELQKNFPRTILINREFEFEEFDVMSDRFATFAEYLLGWAHLVSGNIGIAYKMHLDIYENNKQSFFKRGKLNDLTQILHIEINSILRECRKYPLGFVAQCANKAEKLFPNKDISTLMVARYLVMTSSDDTFESNLSHAISLMNKARINSKNRDAIHSNRAYLYLLKDRYKQAELEYEQFFKKPNQKMIEEIIDYCNTQIKDGCSREQPTALYVKVIMLLHDKRQDTKIKKYLEQAKRKIPPDQIYYHQKLDEITAN